MKGEMFWVNVLVFWVKELGAVLSSSHVVLFFSMTKDETLL